MDSRKLSSATVVPPHKMHKNTNNEIYENSIDDVTTITSNPTLFQKMKNTLLRRHDTKLFDEELQKQSNKNSIKNSRGWMAAILMILVGVLIAITFILVGLGKSLSSTNNNSIATNSTSTTTITITTTLTPTATTKF